MLALLLLVAAAAADERLHPAVDNDLLAQIRMNSPMGLLSLSSGKPVSYCEANNVLNEPLIRNAFFMDNMGSQARERTVGRPVHTKGCGAFGYFEVTRDISHICKASFLSEIGKRTPVAVRFSPAGGERGSSELNRGARGFAVKFYTEDGNFDIPGLNVPNFFTNDPSKFKTFRDALIKTPELYLHDPMRLWDVIIANPQSINMFLYVFSDSGIPASYDHMSGYGVHSMQVRNAKGEVSFVKWHFIPTAGIKYLTDAEAMQLAMTDIDHHSRGLFESIEKGNYPSWSVRVQVVSEEDVARHGFQNIFDVTRRLDESLFPSREVGKLILNRNPENHYAEIELLAFCPGNLVDGIEGAPDRIFQARRFAYADAQRVRLGPDYKEIPVNCPFHGASNAKKSKKGLLQIVEEESYTLDQATDFYENQMNSAEQSRTIATMTAMLTPARQTAKEGMVRLLTQVSEHLGSSVAQGLNITMNQLYH